MNTHLPSKLIPRVRLSESFKRSIKKEEIYVNIEELNKTNNTKEFKTFKSDNDLLYHTAEKVKLRKKAIHNNSKNLSSKSFSVNCDTYLTINNNCQRQDHTISQILGYNDKWKKRKYNYFGCEKLKRTNSFNPSFKIIERGDTSSDGKSMNDKIPHLRRYNTSKFTWSPFKSSTFDKKENIRKDKRNSDIIPEDKNFNIVFKKINQIEDKCLSIDDLPNTEHIYETIQDVIIINFDSKKKHPTIPLKPFIRSFSIFPPDLTFKPRSFKSLSYKNVIC
uniref:Cylicin_N domain-containing protein n=1 Tax=Parastrongyloides trichosuri TaxID=131310 RepID=A0A0N4ZIR7_PARTI